MHTHKPLLLLLLLLLAGSALCMAHGEAAAAASDISQQQQAASASDPSASQVVVLTDANFDSLVQPETGKAGDWIIEFYAPWCSHCKTLTPTWNALAAEVTSSNLHVAKLDATTEVAQAKRFDVRAFPTIKLVSEGRVYTYEGPRSQTALSEFARSRGAGQSSTGVGEAPGQVAMAAERFLALAGDVQTVLMRKPLAGVAFVAVGLMAGVLLSLLVFAFCIDRTPQEFVRFTDETGVTRTVPYVRPPAIALMPVANAGAGGAPAAAAAASPAVKKAQ